MRLMLSGSIDLHLAPDGRIGLRLDSLEVAIVDGSEPRATSSTIPAPSDLSVASRRAHRREHRRRQPTAGCGLCLTESWDPGTRRWVRVEDVEESVEDVDSTRRPHVDSDRSIEEEESIEDRRAAPHVESTSDLIDLPRPDVAALRRRWAGRGKRAYLTAEDLARLDAVTHCGEHDQAWSAAMIRGAPGNVQLIRHLERQHAALHRPRPPDPEQAAEASTSRRDQVLAGYRELVERGEANAVVRSLYERLMAEQPTSETTQEDLHGRPV